MDTARATGLGPPQERSDSSRNDLHSPRSPTLSSSSALSPPSSPTPSSPRSYPHAFPASSFPDRGPPPPRPERRRPPRASATIIAVPPSSNSGDPDNSRNHLNTHFNRRNTTSSSSSSQPRNENPVDIERARKSSQASAASHQAVFGRRGSAQGSSPSEPYPSFQSMFVLSSSHVQESDLEQMAQNSPPTSKPILLTSVEPSSPPAGSSSEMLPLSEFLSQSGEDGKSGRRSPDSPYRSDASGPTFRLYNPPSSPPPPILFSNQSGRVPITTASGEFSGYQQYTPPREHKYGGHSRISSHDHDGPVIGSGYSHETPATIAGSGVVINADEDDYLNQGKPVRNYKVFRGRNVFLCSGRIMTSRDFPAFVMAVLLLLIPTGLFHGFT